MCAKKLVADCGSIRSTLNGLKTKTSCIQSAYTNLNNLSTNNNVSLSLNSKLLYNNLKTLYDKLNSVIEKGIKFANDLENYESRKETYDFSPNASSGTTQEARVNSNDIPASGKYITPKKAKTYTDQDTLRKYANNNSTLKISKGSCIIYARERANIFYKEEYGVEFGSARGIGTAGEFDDEYRTLSGYTVSTTPSVGAIVIFEPNTNGAHEAGHAAFIESISADGKTIIVSESNYNNNPGFYVRTITNVDKLTNVSYITKNVK